MKRIALIFTAVLVTFLLTTGVFTPYVMASQIEWRGWQNATTETFDGRTGNWEWSGNQYKAFHHLSANRSVALVSWTDFGTGLGENLTGYRVKFKAYRVPAGQGTPGFDALGTNIDETIIGDNTYQATAKEFGIPVCYFGSWTTHKYEENLPYKKWENLGNSQVGDTLEFEITVTQQLFKVTVDGYVLDEVINPPNQGKGYFGLMTEHTNLAIETPVIFFDIQYALATSIVLPTTPSPSQAATPSTAQPTPTGSPSNTATPAPSDTVTPAPTRASPTEQVSDSTSDETSLDSSDSDTSQESNTSESGESQSGDDSNGETSDPDSDIETSSDLTSNDGDVDADNGNLTMIYLVSSILVLVIGCTAVYFILKKKGYFR